MDLQKRIESFSILGDFLEQYITGTKKEKLTNLNKVHYQNFKEQISSEHLLNNWFTKNNILVAINGLLSFLQKQELEKWISKYPVKNHPSNKTIGLIMAGNIPFVGFHDLLCILISGYTCVCKMSSKDTRLFKSLLNILIEIDSNFAEKIEVKEDRISNFDAIIATGSNNTSRYFEYYFGKYPHIIRKNRNSVAILSGKESNEELKELGNDILQYFGLGCRNVSKLYVPKNYDYTRLFENVEGYDYYKNHNKYMNNHDYNRSVYLLDQIPHLDNGFLIIKNDEALSSPIAVTYAHEYENLKSAVNIVNQQADNIQCVVSTFENLSIDTLKPGKTQNPGLFDYADNIDTMTFINNL